MPPHLSKYQRIGLALALLYVSEGVETEKRKWIKKRKRKKVLNAIPKVNLVKEPGTDEFRDSLRMDSDCFQELLWLVRPFITKQDTIMRLSVPARDRLIVTLRYLATGQSYREIGIQSGISLQLISKIIPETCAAIYKVLKKEIKMPSTEDEWKAVAKAFEDKWHFNNCVGAMTAKHILIDKPSKSGSLYCNHIRTYSIIVFAIVNADYEFMYVHTGTNGRVVTDEIVANTRFHEKLVNQELNLPESYLLPNTDETVPYVFLDDGTLPVDTHVMNQYVDENLSMSEEIFNYRFKRAHRTAENAFGIVMSRFGVFKKAINVSTATLDAIVLASSALHNFMKKKSKIYWEPSFVDCEDVENFTYTKGGWRDTSKLIPLEQIEQMQTDEGCLVRSTLEEYFSGVGSVSFQNDMLDVVMKEDWSIVN
ncbi:hypothetical protein O3G_MSEX009042 [Manduca sexta]|uniref:DDE Tnp4 domain-containing protein n=1 Tax=Manduca sexta TaxID=7130 RepID=A0A922CPZ4_MANSE|nr:hypothetical protein O3G_MSEX009042 [Manduca sexta]